TRSDPRALRDWLVTQHITLGFAPTPMAEQLLALDWPSDTPLRALLTGADTLRRWPRAGLPFTLVNNYGPSECTVVATSAAVPAIGHSSTLPPIGFPIDGVAITIRDDELRPVPVGEQGEICISGQSVGRGYRNRPELSARVFAVDPSGAPGRLYRTGDRGRLLADGQIAFLGRIDDQIKLRGYRIEPGEIVAALSQHPDVMASAVLVRGDTPDAAHLVAYVAPRSDAVLDCEQLRAFLATHLPDYMLPAVFVRVDHLPLGPNGKVDRAALPAPSAENILQRHQTADVMQDVGHDVAGVATNASPALSPIESRVAGIVEELLNLSSYGLDDNFFMLGGHSLLGAQLVVRLGEMFGVECSLRTLFEAPSIRQLSRAIEDLILAKIDAMQATPALDTVAVPAQRHVTNGDAEVVA
ncbi:MAG TPA: non-ribosomal peptide synthetase, partial [Ktedonobacterales bacterium]